MEINPTLTAIKGNHTQRRWLRSIALPAEHGAWSFTLEPLSLALLVAYSRPGLLLALGALAAFLAHQPLRVWLKGSAEKRPLAMIFFFSYALPAGFFLLWFVFSQRMFNTMPLFITLGLMSLYIAAENSGRGRYLYTEIMASVSMAIISMSITLASGWMVSQAFGLMLLATSRAIPSIFYVRARLRLDKSDSTFVMASYLANTLAFVLVFGLIIYQNLSWLVLLPFCLLLGRALLGMSSYRPRQTVKQIGLWELIFGLQMVTLVSLGYRLSV